MHELELARIIQADRTRDMAEAIRWRRLRDRDDVAQTTVPVVSAGIASTVRVSAPSPRTSAGPSRS